jgi:predicted dehydrogenase
MPGVELVGVADSLPGRAAAIAAPLKTKAFEDYRELLGRVDAVSIATPTTLHAPIGEAFLKAGVHVLVEKPISHTIEDADKLIRAAHENKRVLQVGHLERFNPAVRALREFVNRPRFFEAHRMGLFTPRSLDIDVILDLMIHDLDIISLLVPSTPVKINAVGLPILTRSIDIANARIEFADGCVANVTASRVSMEKIRKLRFFQAREYVSVDYTNQEVAVFSLTGAPGVEGNQILSRKLTPERKEPLAEELSAFVLAIRALGPIECTGDEGRKALDLALQIRAQANAAVSREFDSQ